MAALLPPFGKRGYFFVVDAVVATIIVLVGIFLLYSVSVRSFNQNQPLVVLEDFSTVATTLSLSESTNSYYTGTLLGARVVPFADATPLEEIGYLVYRYQETGNQQYMNYAGNFTVSLFNDSIEDQYGAALIFNGTLVYSRTRQPTSFSMSRKTVVYVRMNETTLRGPAVAEVTLWY